MVDEMKSISVEGELRAYFENELWFVPILLQDQTEGERSSRKH
jgi:hypothetical protein